jgi:hypothetical protein
VIVLWLDRLTTALSVEVQPQGLDGNLDAAYCVNAQLESQCAGVRYLSGPVAHLQTLCTGAIFAMHVTDVV